MNIDLIAMKEHHGSGLCVKDLPLHPLPIVRENMSVYELLDMFQLGMSRYVNLLLQMIYSKTPRIAVVIPYGSNAGNYTASVYHANKNTGTFADKVPLGGTITGTKSKSQLDSLKGNEDHAMDFLSAAKANIDSHGHKHEGIETPKPIGIVTFEVGSSVLFFITSLSISLLYPSHKLSYQDLLNILNDIIIRYSLFRTLNTDLLFM